MSVPIVNRRFNDAASPSKDPWDADDMLVVALVLLTKFGTQARTRAAELVLETAKFDGKS